MQAIFLDDTDGKRYKGVRTAIGNHSKDFLIYDVDADPDEGTNLAPTRTTLQQKMKDKVLQVRIDGDYTRPYLTSEHAPPLTRPVENGLEYKAYTGTWLWTPETAYLTPVDTGESTGLDLSKRTQDDYCLLEFTGYLSVPTDGTYTFQMTTDSTVGTSTSGGMLWVHDAHLIDDDFNHTGAPQSGSMRLKAGMHPIRVLYKHETGDHDLRLQYSGPGITLQDVPESALWREAVLPPEPTAEPDSTSTDLNTPTTSARAFFRCTPRPWWTRSHHPSSSVESFPPPARAILTRIKFCDFSSWLNVGSTYKPHLGCGIYAARPSTSRPPPASLRLGVLQ